MLGLVLILRLILVLRRTLRLALILAIVAGGLSLSIRDRSDIGRRRILCWIRDIGTSVLLDVTSGRAEQNGQRQRREECALGEDVHELDSPVILDATGV